jgi:hypothetical protein
MTRYWFYVIALGVISVAIPVRAANRPHAGTNNRVAWTNEDLERLHVPGLISFVGRMNEETRESTPAPQAPVKTQEPAWYAKQLAKLRDELEQRRAQLGGYRQGIEDARSLKTMTGGINLDDGDIGITPEGGIEILQQRVSKAQAELDELEDLARRHDISPGTLRGQ